MAVGWPPFRSDGHDLSARLWRQHVGRLASSVPIEGAAKGTQDGVGRLCLDDFARLVLLPYRAASRGYSTVSLVQVSSGVFACAYLASHDNRRYKGRDCFEILFGL